MSYTALYLAFKFLGFLVAVFLVTIFTMVLKEEGVPWPIRGVIYLAAALIALSIIIANFS